MFIAPSQSPRVSSAGGARSTGLGSGMRPYAMKTSLLVCVLALGLFDRGRVLAQVGSAPSPLSATPLAIGNYGNVGPVGIPLGATELAAPGISPAPLSNNGCTTTGTTAAPMSPFDGGGVAGGSTSACPSAGSGTATMPTTPAPPALVGRGAGIPLGSTEIANPGLSPLPSPTTLLAPSIVSPAPSAPATTGAAPAPMATPCTISGAFTDQATTRGAATASSSAVAAGAGC